VGSRQPSIDHGLRPWFFHRAHDCRSRRYRADATAARQQSNVDQATRHGPHICEYAIDDHDHEHDRSSLGYLDYGHDSCGHSDFASLGIDNGPIDVGIDSSRINSPEVTIIGSFVVLDASSHSGRTWSIGDLVLA
jgi:hypothetical protein